MRSADQNRRTIRFFPSQSYAGGDDLNIHMFTEDIHLGIVPIGGQARKDMEFSATLIGSESACQLAEELINKSSKYGRGDLSESVCDFIEKIAGGLACEGRAVFEIVKNEQGEQQLFSFTQKRLTRVFRWFIQSVPYRDWTALGKRLNIIDAKTVFCIDIPKVLGGQAGHARLLSRLARYKSIGPSFWVEEMSREGSSKDFEFQKYLRETEIYCRQLTKRWGWNRRDFSQNLTTEFYTFYKILNFRLAQAQLREHIILEINRLFLRLNIVCELKLNGLPSSHDIQRTALEMNSGEIDFGLASKKVSMY